MPATEPNLPVSLENYPPSVGKVVQDLTTRGSFWLCLPITYATADATALYTVPAGLRMVIEQAAWEPTTSFTGGTSSAIGISSNDSSASTKGDILGGSGGDVAATLVSTGVPIKGGTLGAKYASNGIVCLAAGKIVRFDQIASAFTAGAGNVHLRVSFLPTS